jgi:hypothetical protein
VSIALTSELRATYPDWREVFKKNIYTHPRREWADYSQDVASKARKAAQVASRGEIAGMVAGPRLELGTQIAPDFVSTAIYF